MEDLLKKFYEYFIKGNFQDRVNIKSGSEFNNFYGIIINAYDIPKDSQLFKDASAFFSFFDEIDSYGFGFREPGIYSTSMGESISKRRFERDNSASFEWFKPSPHMLKHSSFLFTTFGRDGHLVKAYLSVKPEKYVMVMIKLQEFIDQLYRNHRYEPLGECKFRDQPSNDSIVMRFAKEEHYREFIEFLDKHPEIVESFDTPNVFMPQDKYGVSIVPDNGGSYNYFVTRMIWDYMFYCRDNELDVSVTGITDFIKNYDCSKDEMLYENGDKILNEYKTILIGKILQKPNNELISMIFKDNDKKIKNSKGK